VLESASLDLDDHVTATFTASRDGVPLAVDAMTALSPRFTLATLTAHPVDGLREWKSQLLTGSQTAAKLPPTGPGTPDPEILTSARQPGYETPASFVDLGGGRYRYVFANALVGFDPDETVRVGMWLQGATSPSLLTASTFDFRPSGGPVEARDTVLDESCGRCHGTLVLHGSRTRVRLCLTCHTWQNSDPDTIDPASMSTTATTDPNPLELGRLVHRIHRGKRLPTLYQSSSTAVPAPALNAGNDLPLPFSPESSTTALVGRKYSVIGYQSAEHAYGRVVQRAENAQAPRTVVAGVTFPRDLRDCAVCHGGASQGGVVTSSISRRACSGCHPDVWYGTTPITDQAHLAHPGGPQPDDSACGGCHVGPAAPKLYAPIGEIHVPALDAARYNAITLEIVQVTNLVPGGQPAVRFRVKDEAGALGPELDAPVPAVDPDPVASSFVPRMLTSFSIKISGPTAPDYTSGATSWDPISSGTASGNPDPFALTTVSGSAGWAEYVYTFASTIPAAASGTWTVGMETRRRAKVGHYDKATDTFRWPYTGETVTESPDNPLAYVDTATGTWPPDGPAPRRKIVAEEKCLVCHRRFELHGTNRHRVEYCLLCHTPQATDWAQRPKLSGNVNLAATFDGIEERSIHLKMLVHRIHTGGRTGAASLQGIEPFVVYGYGGTPFFFDEGGFPNDLRNCTVCHEGKSYLAEAVPSDAPPTLANETATVRHASSKAHVTGELSRPPIQAACTGCHATGATFAHVAAKTVGGVETCTQCHSKGALSVEVVHGMAPAGGGAGATFSSIVEAVLVPRCATAACHSGDPPVASPRLDAGAAYAAMVGVSSAQTGTPIVAPGAPENSYLLSKLRGDAGIVGQPMPIGDSALDAADLAAIEAWIANGAQND
jgi:OmcA/MtrC family decaheme c-type cytochrome